MALSPDEVAEAANEASATSRIPARHFEKDYYVTAILRELAASQSEVVQFKGGTSLSKAYGLIDRFSEDIDLLVKVDDDAGDDVVETLLDEITAAALKGLGAGGSVRESKGAPGRSRQVKLGYPVRSQKQAGGPPKVIWLEPGRRGGAVPSEVRSLRPLLMDHLGGLSGEDMDSFDIEVLHPARTLVEKILHLHSLGVRMGSDPSERPRSRQARHFYDVYWLLTDTATVGSYLAEPGNLAGLVADCLAVTEHWFGAGANPPLGESLADGAVFGEALSPRLEAEYQRTCTELCYPGAVVPAWGEVLAKVRSSRELLTFSS